MKPEKQQLIQHLLADAEDLRRQATLSSCGPILRRRRWQRRRRSLTMITLLALAALSLPRWVPPRKPILTAVAPAQGAGLRSLTDAELLALFPATPVGLVTLENGRKRLIFPRPGDEARFVRHL